MPHKPYLSLLAIIIFIAIMVVPLSACGRKGPPVANANASQSLKSLN